MNKIYLVFLEIALTDAGRCTQEEVLLSAHRTICGAKSHAEGLYELDWKYESDDFTSSNWFPDVVSTSMFNRIYIIEREVLE